MSNQKQGKGQQTAATHSGGMRAEAKKSKIVFKNVLDTPFNIPWPEVTADDNIIVLDALCELLEPIRSYHYTPNGKELSTAGLRKKEKATKPNTALAAAPEILLPEASNSQSSPPPILSSVCIGINSVTKALERSIQDLAKYPSPSAVFLCKADLAPAHLYNHLGPMIAMLPKTLLFPLEKGSEQRLGKALGMKAVGAVAVLAGSKEAEDLVMILERLVEPMSAPWLPKVKVASPKGSATEESVKESGKTAASADSTPAPTVSKSNATWIPTNIKSVKTTMPIVVKTPKPTTAATTTITTTTTAAAAVVVATVSKPTTGNTSMRNQQNPQSQKSQKRVEGPHGDHGKDKKTRN